MSEIDVKGLAERGERAALLIGQMFGGISAVLSGIDKGITKDIEDVYNELSRINHMAFDRINDIYYKHLEEAAEHE